MSISESLEKPQDAPPGLPALLPCPDPPQARGEAPASGNSHSTRDPLAAALELVLNACNDIETKRHYGRALVEFSSFCRARRLELHRTAVHAWRNHLVEQGLSPSTINQKLGAVRKLATEAAASGMLSAEAAAQVRSVPGIKQRGNRMGNWLTPAQAQELLYAPPPNTLKGKRDHCALALLVGCGLRRDEAARLTVEHIQMRDARWVIIDLRGKHGRVRTITVPAFVKVAVDTWTTAAGITAGRILRAINKGGRITHDSLSGNAVYELAAQYGEEIGVEICAHDLRRTCARICRKTGAELEQIQLLLGHSLINTTQRYLGTELDLTNGANDRMKLKGRGL